jgi:hypothetical protein
MVVSMGCFSGYCGVGKRCRGIPAAEPAYRAREDAGSSLQTIPRGKQPVHPISGPAKSYEPLMEALA